MKQNIALTETGDGLQSEAKVLGHLSVLPENDSCEKGGVRKVNNDLSLGIKFCQVLQGLLSHIFSITSRESSNILLLVV